MNILQWLAGHDVGLSSKAIALTALGEMPPRPNYPHDGADFGRCHRLLEQCPDAWAGLERLGKEGGEVWQALVPRWDDIKAAYLADLALYESGARYRDAPEKYRCYDLMQSIIRPIEDKWRAVYRGEGFTIRTGI